MCSRLWKVRRHEPLDYGIAHITEGVTVRMQYSWVLAVVLFASACGEPRPSSLDADLRAIQAVDDATVQAVMAGDVDGYLAQFTDSATVIVPNVPPVRGKDALRAWVAPLLEDNEIEITLSVQDRRVSGDWAFEILGYHLRITPKSGGETVEDRGSELVVFRREPDDSWRVHAYAYNSDLPVAAP